MKKPIVKASEITRRDCRINSNFQADKAKGGLVRNTPRSIGEFRVSPWGYVPAVEGVQGCKAKMRRTALYTQQGGVSC